MFEEEYLVSTLRDTSDTKDIINDENNRQIRRNDVNNSNALKQTFNNWTQRLWFLTNGSLRLSPMEASKLALWPEESDPNDDRIINQLMFVPFNYNNKTPIKSIYLSTNDEDWRLSFGTHEFKRCPVSSCELVPQTKLMTADLIFFKTRYISQTLLSFRKKGQIWAKFELESPMNSWMESPVNTINWTVTYRHDSEISVPYFKYFPFDKQTIVNINNKHNYAIGKSRKVAWFVTNCYADNVRLEYALELGKYISVDIYGRCGPFDCPKNGNEKCNNLLKKEYKFYLSFENSNCQDYITEKFWLNALNNDVLPIVMGAHPSQYERLAPPNSYIHVDHFKSPKHLAKYLHVLDSNDELYNKYFEWKGMGQIKEIFMWCRLCALLHAPQRHKVYNDVSKWWDSKKSCVPITWTNMNVSKVFTEDEKSNYVVINSNNKNKK